MIDYEDDSHGDDELGVGVVDSLGGLEGKGAKSCEDSKKLRLLSRVHLVDNMNKMVVEKMTWPWNTVTETDQDNNHSKSLYEKIPLWHLVQSKDQATEPQAPAQTPVG